jgi:hypothetical protein
MSEEAGHKHNVLVTQSKDVDPATGQPAPKLIFKVTSAKNHTHELTKNLDYQKKKSVDGEEREMITKVYEYLIESAAWMETGFFKVARECDKFRKLNQWDSTVLATMPADKAALVVPIVNAQLDILKGVQLQNKTEPTVLPGDTGDMRTADIQGQMIKNILEQNKYETIESRVFADQVDLGLGWATLDIDRKNDTRGKFKIGYYDWDNCMLSPFNELDGSDAQHGEKIKWFDVEALKVMFPDKADEIGKFSSRGGIYPMGTDNIDSGNDIDAKYGTPTGFFNRLINKDKGLIKTIECQYKEHRSVPVVVNLENGLYEPLPDINSEELKKILTIEGVSKTIVPDEKIIVALVVGNVLLYQGVSELDRIGIFPAIGKKFKNIIFGKYAEALDMQKHINKSESRMADSENFSNDTKTYIDDETFTDPEEEQYFIENGNKDPGYVGKVGNTNKIPVRDIPARVPNQSMALDNNWRQRASDLTNVQLANQVSPYESNIGMLNKQKTGLLGNEYLFVNNWIMTEAIVNTILKALPKVYATSDRYFRVLDNRYKQGKFMRINKEDFSTYTEQDIEEVIKNYDPTAYDCKVAESSYSPTKMQYAFENWKDIYKQSGGRAEYMVDFLVKLDPSIPESQKQEFMQIKKQFYASQQQGDTGKIQEQGNQNVKLEIVKQIGKQKENGSPETGSLPLQAVA